VKKSPVTKKLLVVGSEDNGTQEVLLPAEVLFMPPAAQYGKIKIEDG
jgi:hypothetical protein